MGTVEIDPKFTGKVKRVTLEATVIRANGAVEELGIIADSSRWHNFLRWCGKIMNGRKRKA